MKKHIALVLVVFAVLAAVGLLLSQSTPVHQEATMLQIEDAAVYDSLESIMNDTTFFVKAALKEETPYLEGTSYRYQFSLIDDYAGNMRTEDGAIFNVYSFTSGLYEAGETYYLFLTAQESYMANTIMYMAVDDRLILQYDDRLLFDRVNLSGMTLASMPSSASRLEHEICDYTEASAAAIQEKTAQVFSSDAFPTLESTVAAAEAIWLVTILSCEAVNPNASICEYRIDHVFRGNTETAPVGSEFNGIYPTEKISAGSQYYLVLADVGDYEYRPFSFDHWLIPAESEESAELLAMLEEVE